MLAALVIACATLGAYSNSFDGIFVFDDEPAVQQNLHLRHIWPLTASMSAPDDSTLSGRPVASLSFAIDYARGGGHALATYHATNLAIHIAAALLLFGVVRRTLRSAPLQAGFGGASAPLAAVVALLWALHPVQTASVTYIVQRVESLMGLFYLATLSCAIRALDVRRRRMWTALAVTCCALGMGTKEVMATAPLTVMIWDWLFAPAQGRSRRTLYVALGGCWLLLGLLLAGGPRSFSVGFGFAGWPWWRYLLTQAGVVAHYVRLTFVPWPLVLDYGWPAASLAQAAAPGLLIVALVAGTTVALLRRSPAAMAGAWFFLILAPTSSVVPIVTEIAAEHRLYLPLAAPVALVVIGVFVLARRFRLAGRTPALAGYASAALVAATLGALTYARNEDYRSYDRIWSRTIQARPENARARNNYATSLMAQGRSAEALPHLRAAIAARPDFADARTNLGVALCTTGQCDAGIAELRRALSIDPDYAAAYRNLAEAYATRGQMSSAVENYTAALQRRPDDVELLNRVAWILATTPDDRLRDGARARAFAERAVGLTDRRDAVSLDSLAAALAELGRFDEAAAIAGDALAAARASGNTAMLPELEFRLALYQRGERFRDNK